MKLSSKFLVPLLVVVLTVFALLPLARNGFYTMHDDEQVARLYDLNQALVSGNIPPRIAPNLGFGYGYPFFNFYPSFAYYVGEVFHLSGFSYLASTKLMLAVGFILSALFIYLLVKDIFGEAAGVVASVAYTYAPYRALDVYVRGAYAEFFSFVFLPLIFWSVYRLSKTNKNLYLIICALSVFGLITSHNLIALMSTVPIGIWLAYLLVVSKKKLRFFLKTCTAFILGFGVSAYFSLPSYFEKGYTLVNILTGELASYSLHFVCAYQLWDSPWGYGGSILGCYDGISFEIGKIQIIFSVLALFTAVFLFIHRKRSLKEYSVFIFFLIFILSIFMTVKQSKFIWEALPPFWYIQFPWRFLLITSLAAAFLTGALVGFIKNKPLKSIASSILVAVIIILSLSKFTPQRFFNATDQDYTNLKKLRWETSSLAYEYVPNGIKTITSDIGTTKVDITQNEIASNSSMVINGVMSVREVKNLPQYKKFSLSVFEPGLFQINTFSFPGWTVYIDGREVSFTDNNKLKLIRVIVPSGNHIIEAKFLDTPVRTIGNLISLISIILLVMVAVFSSVKLKKTKNET